MKIAALIPALDCAETIDGLVREVRQHLDHVLVVDDGSRDGTAATAAAAGAEVLSHPSNQGKGAALMTGLEELGRRGFSHALSLDGDGQHLPAEIPVLLAAAGEAPEAIVVGARKIESEVAAVNLFGNRFANFWVWVATGRDLGDTQCGFRIYPIAATLGLEASGRRFDFETEILIRAARRGLPVRSVPIRIYYPPPEVRTSHFDRVWDTLRIIRSVVELLLRVR